jgi:hypothetical protein
VDYWNADEMLAGFLAAGRKENAGVIALLVCIAGDVSANTALNIFCGLTAKEYVPRKNSEPLDINKLRLGMDVKKITHKELCKAIHRSQGTISKLFYDNQGRKYCYKDKRFLRDCEKALGMAEGELIYKGEII